MEVILFLLVWCGLGLLGACIGLMVIYRHYNEILWVDIVLALAIGLSAGAAFLLATITAMIVFSIPLDKKVFERRQK